MASFAKAFDLKETAHSQYFRLLLHYKKNLWGLDQSEADGQEFFLSPNGKLDLESELQADIKAFSNPINGQVGPLHQHPQCAFPERFRFVKEQTKLQFPKIDCPEFQRWKSQFKAHSLTLVYAAPYLGSPASMFGHSFLRIDHSEKALLDYGISFEAVTGPDPGFLYAIKGLTGLYPGIFSQMAYYLKVNTYTNVDSRDLWEYELNLNEDQISRMLSHIWEMGTTYFDYYFFNKNCSYQLLSLIEVANAEMDLRSQFGPMAIPIDTIRAVTRYPGAIRKRTSRPSLMKILNERMQKFSPENRERFYQLKQNISLISNHEDAGVLDALLDVQKYQSMNSSKTLQETNQKIEQKLLIARAKVESLPSTIKTSALETEQNSPENAHLTSKLSLSYGRIQNLKLVSFQFRPAIHDLLDSDRGYIPFSSLLIAQTQLSYLMESNNVRLEEFKVAEVTNFSPLTRLSKNLSWLVGGRIYHPNDINCKTCIADQVYTGGGASIFVFQDHVLIYSLLKGYAEYTTAFRAAPVIEVGALSKVEDHIKASLSIERLWYFPQILNSSLFDLKFAMAYEVSRYQIKLSLENLIFSDQANSQTNSLISFARYY